MPRPKKTVLESQRSETRLRCELDFIFFINTVAPKRLLGSIHIEICKWLSASNANSYQLLLLPRDHMKSALSAFFVAWLITKDPTLRILYISSTSLLATKQLKFIKDILTSTNYRLLWPEMVNVDEAKREKWTEREISVDDPRRAAESIRDATIFTAGLTTNIVGLHCDVIVFDDGVTAANAYTEEGREKTREQYSYLSSVQSTHPRVLVVGTRYHPKDLYPSLQEMTVDEHNEYGEIIHRRPLYDVKEYPVESIGDGTGEFLWPRQQRSDGKWFGFDQKVLAEKRSQYINKTHFRAQYYNDPHDVDSSPIGKDLFQYYEPGHLSVREGRWFFRGNRLNLIAAVDFAYTTGVKSDYTSIVVIGADGQLNYYVLEIERFKTSKISEVYNRLFKMYEKWGFRKLMAETTAGQRMIVEDIRDNYIRPAGLSLSVEEYSPSRFEGSKNERIMAVLEPRYHNRQIWHYPGGNCQVLEEELVFQNSQHDDCKDALACAVKNVIAPLILNQHKTITPTLTYHSRFGGVV